MDSITSSPTWQLVSSLGFHIVHGWKRTTEQDDADWTLALHCDKNAKSTIILVLDPMAPKHEQILALNEPAQETFGPVGEEFSGWRLWALVGNALLTPDKEVAATGVEVGGGAKVYDFFMESIPQQKLVVVRGVLVSNGEEGKHGE